MARALWTGSLRFDLVRTPANIHTAFANTGLRFRMLRKKHTSPIHFQRVAERDSGVVEWGRFV